MVTFAAMRTASASAASSILPSSSGMMLLLRILVIATTLFLSSDAFGTPVSHLQGSRSSSNHYPQYSQGILRSQSSSSSSLIQPRRRHRLIISTSTRLSLINDPCFSSSGILAAAADSANLFQGALSIYKQHLLTEPLKTKVLTGIVLAIVGDALAQYSSSRTTTTTITEEDGGPQPFEYNVKRAISFATFDGCYRAVQQVTYPPMMKICNGKFSLALLSSTVLALPSFPPSTSSIDSSTQATSYLLHILASFEQTLFSQLLIIPIIYYPTFYIVTSFVQGLSLSQTIHRIKCTFIPLMKRNLLFWIPIQFVTFAFVDESTNLQIPILIVCGLVWTIILSITAGATSSTTTTKEECKKEEEEEEELPEDAILSKTNEEYKEAVTLLIDMPTTYDDGNNNKDEEDLDGGGGRGGGNTSTTYTPETSTTTTTTTALRQTTTTTTTTTTITSLRMKLLSFITFASIMSCNAYAVTTTATTTTTTRRLWRNNIITPPSKPTTKTGIPRSTSIVRRLHPDDDGMSSNTNQVEEGHGQDAVDKTLKYNILRISALVATTLLGTHMYPSTSSSINLFERYNYLLKYKPLRTKVITGATLAVLGDGIAQLRSSSSSSRMNARYNPRRALSFATFDGCYRIFQHVAFPYIISSCQGRVVGKIISSSSGGKNIQLACAALERTLVYQLLVIPILYYPIFFTFTGYIQGLTLSQILTRARSSFIPCWKRNLLFWIPCQFIMFSVINERWQIPFACLLGMLWSSILSITAGNANKK